MQYTNILEKLIDDKTERGYHTRSLNSNGGWNMIGCQSFMNMPILQYASKIRNAVLIIYSVVNTTLYDQTNIIPFDKMT